MSRRILTLATEPRRPLGEKHLLLMALRPKGQPQPRVIFDRLMELWTLQEYIDWINSDSEGSQLMGAEDWAEHGITTAVQLGEYLDSCVEREKQKDMMR